MKRRRARLFLAVWASALVVAIVLMVLPLVHRPDPFGSNQLASASKDPVVLDDASLEFVTTVPAGFVVAPHVQEPDTRLVLVAEAWLPNTATISITVVALRSNPTGIGQPPQQPKDILKLNPGGYTALPEADEARTADGRPALPVTRGPAEQDERILRFAVIRDQTMYVIRVRLF